MSGFETIIRGATVVTADGLVPADLGIDSGKLVAFAPGLAGDCREEIDASGLHLFPGVIDAHVHFNEPGRAQWEGLETGSRALAAGGGTLFFDMPLNAHPPTIDRESFMLKLQAAQNKSLVDFAFWGGLVPGNLDRLEELAECGVIGFKAFMCNSGIDDFSQVDDRTLREGMKRAARLGLPVAVHAESEAMTRQLAQQYIAAGRTSVCDFLETRPVEAELEAIGRALDLAGETGCELHVVHVSCGAAIRLIAEARRRGVKVSCETCPHYLLLTAQDMERIGPMAKCAPPLRSKSEQDELWKCLLAGEIDTVGSDHSPSPPEMKQGADFFKVWGGISSVQHTLPLLLTALSDEQGRGGNARVSSSSFSVSAAERQIEHEDENEKETPCALPQSPPGLCLFARLLSEHVARRFKLPKAKGRIAVGADTDIVLVDLAQSLEIRTEDLLYRHAQTPYLRRRLQGRVVRTMLRGQTVFRDGKIVAKPLGHLVKPVK
ncbi:MAG TPA: allantoinase AllB [Candidatus Binatia bacterium]|jgi:allantoinase|nr:allantoinase AllB [Candidatus Binatia bacterium]